MPSDDTLIRLRGVSKDYRSLRPLRIAELDLPPGRSLALLGFDQMMAEVFVDLITGAILPDTGEVIRLRQADLLHRRSRRLADDPGSVWFAHGPRRARRAVHGRTEPGASTVSRGREHVPRRTCPRGGAGDGGWSRKRSRSDKRECSHRLSGRASASVARSRSCRACSWPSTRAPRSLVRMQQPSPPTFHASSRRAGSAA